MARIPEAEIERLKREVSVERLAEARGVKLQAARRGPHRPVPLPRRPRTDVWSSARRKISGTVSARAAREARVIDWVMRAEGISFRHAVELLREDHLPLAASPRRAAANLHGAEAARAGEPRRGRPRAALASGELLPRDAEEVAGRAEVSRRARPEILRDDRALPAGLRQPHAGLSAAARRTA